MKCYIYQCKEVKSLLPRRKSFWDTITSHDEPNTSRVEPDEKWDDDEPDASYWDRLTEL